MQRLTLTQAELTVLVQYWLGDLEAFNTVAFSPTEVDPEQKRSAEATLIGRGLLAGGRPAARASLALEVERMLTATLAADLLCVASVKFRAAPSQTRYLSYSPDCIVLNYIDEDERQVLQPIADSAAVINYLVALTGLRLPLRPDRTSRTPQPLDTLLPEAETILSLMAVAEPLARQTPVRSLICLMVQSTAWLVDPSSQQARPMGVPVSPAQLRQVLGRTVGPWPPVGAP